MKLALKECIVYEQKLVASYFNGVSSDKNKSHIKIKFDDPA